MTLRLLQFFLLLATTMYGVSQNATLQGTVRDINSRDELIGVSVRVEGSTTGAVTDFDGNYTLILSAGTYTIVFSYVGYEEKSANVTLKPGEIRVLNMELGDLPMLIDALVVTASRYEKKLGEETVSLSVISPAFLEKQNMTNITQALEKTPGVTMIDGQANIRGGSGYSYGAGSRVLLLQDDIPILQADAGFPTWSNIALETIGQIEIIKGAASALYGSSAMNGIINVRTAYPTDKPVTKVSFFSTVWQNPNKKEFDPSIDDFIEVEKNWWRDETIQLADTVVENKQDKQPHDIGFSMSHRQKFGKVDVVIGSFVQKKTEWRYGSFENRGRINGAVRYRASDKITLGLSTNFMLSYSGTFFLWAGTGKNKYIPGITGVPTTTKGVRFNVDPYFNYMDTKGNRHKILGKYFKIDNYNTNNQGNFSQFTYGEYQYQRFIDKIGMVVSGGITASYTRVEAELYGDTVLTGNNLAGYAQIDQKLFNKLNLTVGFRYETNKLSLTERESKPVFRAGINYQAGKYTYLRASFGQGYRFPTIAEKFISTNLGGTIFIFQNRNLKSETGYSAELGFKQGIRIGKLNALFDVSAFYTEYTDMMEFNFTVDEDLNIGFQSQNIGNTRIYGVETTLAGEGKLANKFPVTMLIGYTWINPQFKGFDEPIPGALDNSTPRDNSLIKDYNVLKYRFRHTFNGGFDMKFNFVEFGVTAQYLSFMENIDEVFTLFIPGLLDWRESRQRDDFESRDPKRAYKGDFVLDARIGFYFGKNEQAKISAQVKNITNREYSLRPALIEAPRSYGMRLDFNF